MSKSLRKKKKLPQWLSGLPNHKIKEIPKQESEQPASVIEASLKELIYNGEVIYSTNHEDCDLLCDDLLSDSATECLMVGFDMEWPVSYTQGQEGKAALLQLCYNEKQCYLFHVAAMEQFPSMLRELILNGNMIFVGVGIQGDLWKLERSFNIRVLPVIQQRTIDLGRMANDVLKSSEQWSLDNLTRHVLGAKLNKDCLVRTSDWDKWPLTEAQQRYAAVDAYASWRIYHQLQRLKDKADTR